MRDPTDARPRPDLVPAASALLALTAAGWVVGGVEAQEVDRQRTDDGDARAVVVVRDDGSRLPLRAVRVRLAGPDGTGAVERSATTDRNGAVRFEDLPPGTYRIRASQMGYGDAETELSLEAGEARSTDLLMSPRPVEVGGIETEVAPGSWIAGFRWRREHVDGHFFTRKEIAEEDPERVTDLLRSLPHVRVRYRPDRGWYTTMVSRSAGRAEDARCQPHIVLDGEWLPRDVLAMSLDEVEPEDVLAMEVYWKEVDLPEDLDVPPAVLGERSGLAPGAGTETAAGAAGSRGPTSLRGLDPVPFSDTRTVSCGVVVLWTELKKR